MRDNIHNDSYKIAIAPVVVTDNAAQVGNWIDEAAYDSLSFAILTGTIVTAAADFYRPDGGSGRGGPIRPCGGRRSRHAEPQSKA